MSSCGESSVLEPPGNCSFSRLGVELGLWGAPADFLLFKAHVWGLVSDGGFLCFLLGFGDLEATEGLL